eukprot:UN09678
MSSASEEQFYFRKVTFYSMKNLR